MKKQSYRLSVSNPCHRDWDGMAPDAKGRFCQACQKTVIDFSYKSDSEIYETLKKGNVCGRFRQSQVAEPLVVSTPAAIPFWKAAIVAGISFFSFKTAEGKSAWKKSIEFIQPLKKKAPKEMKGPDTGPTLKRIHISLLDSETHKPVTFAEISVTEPGDQGEKALIKVNSDSIGQVVISMPVKPGMKLTCSAPYYKQKKIIVDSFDDRTIYMVRDWNIDYDHIDDANMLFLEPDSISRPDTSHVQNTPDTYYFNYPKSDSLKLHLIQDTEIVTIVGDTSIALSSICVTTGFSTLAPLDTGKRSLDSLRKNLKKFASKKDSGDTMLKKANAPNPLSPAPKAATKNPARLPIKKDLPRDPIEGGNEQEIKPQSATQEDMSS